MECLNPNTGRRMLIDAATYELFSKAIYYTLMEEKQLTFTQMVEGVRDCFKKQKTSFDGSVEWYTVTVKNHLQAKGVMEAFPGKGKKLHRLAAAQPKTRRAPF